MRRIHHIPDVGMLYLRIHTTTLRRELSAKAAHVVPLPPDPVRSGSSSFGALHLVCSWFTTIMCREGPSSTQAEEKLRLFASDRAAQFDSLLAKLGEDSEQGRKLLAAHQTGSGSKDVLGEYLTQVVDSIERALRGPLASHLVRDPGLLRFGISDEEDAAAHVQGFGDGSGLVLASNALLALCLQLGILNLSWQARLRIGTRPSFWGAFRLDRAARSDTVDSILVASLRFYLVQQRLYGLSAMRIPRLRKEEHEDNATVLAHAAIMFVLAHEAAHFVLGHAIESGASTLAGRSTEFEADAFALLVVHVALSLDLGPQTSRLPVIGALVALLATHVSEKALFVRPTRTHPPAQARIDALIRGKAQSAQGVFTVMHGLVRASEYASEIYRPVPQEWWHHLRQEVHPQFLVDGDKDPLRQTATLDRWRGQPPDIYKQYLQTEGTSSTAAFMRTLSELEASDVPAALAALGLQPRQIGRLIGAGKGLAFNTLMQAIASCPVLGAVSQDRRQPFAITLAYCLETRIRGMGDD